MVKSLLEIGRAFDTDKVESEGYTSHYEKHFGALRDQPVALLELGVYHGGSLQMWHEYFASGRIVGMDISPNPLATLPERVRFYQGSQDDVALLDRVAQENAPDGFDIIIDDAAHVGTIARTSYRTLFNKHLKSGGIYVIEDWGTGYWGTWPDGALYQPAGADPAGSASSGGLLRAKLARRIAQWLGGGVPAAPDTKVDPHFASHNFGMVGFVKEVVDHLAWGDITRAGRGHAGLAAHTPAGIREISIYQGQVFVTKA